MASKRNRWIPEDGSLLASYQAEKGGLAHAGHLRARGRPVPSGFRSKKHEPRRTARKAAGTAGAGAGLSHQTWAGESVATDGSTPQQERSGTSGRKATSEHFNPVSRGV